MVSARKASGGVARLVGDVGWEVPADARLAGDMSPLAETLPPETPRRAAQRCRRVPDGHTLSPTNAAPEGMAPTLSPPKVALSPNGLHGEKGTPPAARGTRRCVQNARRLPRMIPSLSPACHTLPPPTGDRRKASPTLHTSADSSAAVECHESFRLQTFGFGNTNGHE